MFDASLHFMGLLSPDGILLDANRTALDLVGLTLEDVQGRPFWETSWWTHDPDQQARLRAGIQQAAMGESFEMEATHMTLEGRTLLVGFSLRPIKDAQGRVAALLPEARDISDLVDERERLRISEMRFRSLFERSVEGLLLLEGDRFTDCNQAVLDMMQCTEPEFLRMHPWELSPPIQPDGRASDEKAMDMMAMAHAKGVHRFEWMHRRMTGEDFPVEVTLIPIPLGGTDILFTSWRDITDQKKAEQNRLSLERQMLHAQKLESLGVLAGGIAHDFNNLLTAILANLNLAEAQLPEESPALARLKATERAALKAADLTRQMLAYSGKGRFVVRAHDLNLVVQEVANLVRVSIAKKVNLTFSLEEGLPLVEADEAQVQQVILNLVTNASDAIGDRVGEIRIATRARLLDESFVSAVLPGQGLASGQYVVLEVGDTGGGMSPEIQAKIFDPFYTTKPTGHGLGLSAILGILRGHQAGLKVYSEPGRGTTFQLYFPSTSLPLPKIQEHPQSPEVAFSGLVLLVDDESSILEVTSKSLEHLGFEVETASDGREAVEKFSRRSADYRVALLDLTMPRMDGRECFQALRQLRPDLPVIVCSGFSEQESVKEFLGQGLTGFIQKPYTLSMLRKAFFEALQG